MDNAGIMHEACRYHEEIMYWSCRDHSEDHAGIRQTVINTKKAGGQPSETKELKLPWLRQHVKRKYYPLNVRRLTFAREAILKHGKRCTVRICQLTEWRLKNQCHESFFSMNPSWIFKLSNRTVCYFKTRTVFKYISKFIVRNVQLRLAINLSNSSGKKSAKALLKQETKQ
jgi:hypothetical protein